MSPSVLARVISGKLELDAKTLKVHPARLDGFKRHKVKNADYPAVVKGTDTDSVLGTVVYNLTDEEVSRLDIFEGNEYKRVSVKVLDATSGDMVDSNIYLWIDSKERLLDEEWDFEYFVKHRMESWISDEMKELEESQVDPRGKRFWDPNAVKQQA